LVEDAAEAAELLAERRTTETDVKSIVADVEAEAIVALDVDLADGDAPPETRASVVVEERDDLE
jgi:hypothetical protein